MLKLFLAVFLAATPAWAGGIITVWHQNAARAEPFDEEAIAAACAEQDTATEVGRFWFVLFGCEELGFPPGDDAPDEGRASSGGPGDRRTMDLGGCSQTTAASGLGLVVLAWCLFSLRRFGSSGRWSVPKTKPQS